MANNVNYTNPATGEVFATRVRDDGFGDAHVQTVSLGEFEQSLLQLLADLRAELRVMNYFLQAGLNVKDDPAILREQER